MTGAEWRTAAPGIYQFRKDGKTLAEVRKFHGDRSPWTGYAVTSAGVQTGIKGSYDLAKAKTQAEEKIDV